MSLIYWTNQTQETGIHNKKLIDFVFDMTVRIWPHDSFEANTYK